MALDSWQNLVSMFYEQADRLGERPFLWSKREGAYHPLSWRDVAARVTALARGLQAIGVEAGDRVVIVSENRPEWLIADLAIMAAGGITVPAYTTNTEADHLHILADSGAKGAIVSNWRLAERLLPAIHRAGNVRFVVAIEPLPSEPPGGIEFHPWDSLLARGQEIHFNVVHAARQLRRTDTACIIYTSGTGGAPKGVMLHHGAILHNCRGAAEALRGLDLNEEVYLSFLPLSHSYEHTVGVFFVIAVAAQVYYAEGAETLAANLVEVRPTFMTAVPRLYEVLHDRILRAVGKSGRVRRYLFHRALDLGRRRYHSPDRLGVFDRLVDAVVDRLVRDRIRGQFGGRLKALVSGGAPLNPEIGLFFQALGLTILQGYGQTEAAPVISVNCPGRQRMDTVGPPLKDTEVRIAADGEILVRGELVMQGYWNNPEASREALRDGWLHTGDIGQFDDEGHLRITDRKKDLIVNSGGDNISPVRIEGMLTMEPEIAQAMVYGDRRPHLVALLVPAADWLRGWAQNQGLPADAAALTASPALKKALGLAVERVNAKLSLLEKVRRFAIAESPFSVDNGQLTPTLKIRRHVIRQVYAAALDGLYR
jgi:long-chain acyl-CoA synthetase